LFQNVLVHIVGKGYYDVKNSEGRVGVASE